MDVRKLIKTLLDIEVNTDDLHDKRIRKYMGSLVVISQNVIDFLAPDVQRHGQAILDNPTYKLLLAQGEKDRQILAGLMNLSESEEEFLTTANRGEGLLVAGAQRVRVKIEAARMSCDT